MIISVTCFLKASEDESCKSLVTVLRCDLNDAFIFTAADVVVGTFVAADSVV